MHQVIGQERFEVCVDVIQCIIHAAKRICSMLISDQALYVCLS